MAEKLNGKLSVKLKRNLRRSIQRGHPWIYREALDSLPAVQRAQLCRISDNKGELAWAIYDPHGPLSLRVLSLDKIPPTKGILLGRLDRALKLRDGIRSEMTTGYRLINGEGDLFPGLICDVYDSIAVVQFDGQGPSEFWDRTIITDWLMNLKWCQSVVEKSRRSSEQEFKLLAGAAAPAEVEILENGARYRVNIEMGQKTGFFLDQRDNRQFVRQISHGKDVLNLFSYTGGFSVAAGLGGATRVTSVDVARGAIDLANINWQLNHLEAKSHQSLCVDVFAFLKEPGDLWSHVVVDPPSMGHSEEQRANAVAKYVDLFALAARRVTKGGHFSVSSCSSHVSFTDFFEIITEALSLARRRGQILRVSGQPADHPFPHACHELRYLKFVHLVLD